MNPFKLKKLKNLAKKLIEFDQPLAQEIDSLIYSIENKPHLGNQTLQPSLSDAIKKITALIGNIDFCLIGGLAVQYWIDIRKTDDIDIVVFAENLQKVKKTFPGGRDILYGYSFSIDHVHVDVLSTENFLWAKEAIEVAKPYDFFGIKIKVALPEYLILFKMIPMRDRDVSDILGLLSLETIPNKARNLVWKFLPAETEDLEQMIKMAELGQC